MNRNCRLVKDSFFGIFTSNSYLTLVSPNTQHTPERHWDPASLPHFCAILLLQNTFGSLQQTSVFKWTAMTSSGLLRICLKSQPGHSFLDKRQNPLLPAFHSAAANYRKCTQNSLQTLSKHTLTTVSLNSEHLPPSLAQSLGEVT